MKRVDLWTDGSGVNGPGAWGAILVHGDAYRLLGGYLPQATNNLSETVAVLKGLVEIKVPCVVHVVTDSQYVRFGLSRCIENRSLLKTHTQTWESIRREIKKHPRVTVDQVPGHSNIELNEMADTIAGYCAKFKGHFDEKTFFEPGTFNWGDLWSLVNCRDNYHGATGVPV